MCGCIHVANLDAAIGDSDTDMGVANQASWLGEIVSSEIEYIISRRHTVP